MIHDARDHEQEIGQAIDVRQHQQFDAISTQGDNRPLRAAADGPREVQQRARATASGQYETSKRRELGIESIDPVFEAADVGVGNGHLCDAVGDLLGWIGKPGADGKAILLQLLEQFDDIPGKFALRADHPEARVQFVHIAVRGHARIGFRDAGSAEQRSTARIAGPRVDLHARQYT